MAERGPIGSTYCKLSSFYLSCSSAINPMSVVKPVKHPETARIYHRDDEQRP
jgi:hypothetical protein